MVSGGVDIVISTSYSPGFPAVVSVEFISLRSLINFPSEIWSSCCPNMLQGKDCATRGGMLLKHYQYL